MKEKREEIKKSEGGEWKRRKGGKKRRENLIKKGRILKPRKETRNKRNKVDSVKEKREGEWR